MNLLILGVLTVISQRYVAHYFSCFCLFLRVLCWCFFCTVFIVLWVLSWFK